MRKSLALAAASCGLLLGLARPPAALAQGGAPAARSAAAEAPIGSGFTPVSATTSAAWFVRDDPAAGRSLALLVLWRGAEGWEAGADRAGGFSGGPVSAGTSAGWHRAGTVLLTWEFDPARRVVRVADQEVALGDDNVLLVDSVDGSAGPMKVVGTTRFAADVDVPRREVHGTLLRAVHADPALARFIR